MSKVGRYVAWLSNLYANTRQNCYLFSHSYVTLNNNSIAGDFCPAGILFSRFYSKNTCLLASNGCCTEWSEATQWPVTG